MTQLTLNIENTDFIDKLKELISRFDGVSIAKRMGKEFVPTIAETKTEESELKSKEVFDFFDKVHDAWCVDGRTADEDIELIYGARRSKQVIENWGERE